MRAAIVLGGALTLGCAGAGDAPTPGWETMSGGDGGPGGTGEWFDTEDVPQDTSGFTQGDPSGPTLTGATMTGMTGMTGNPSDTDFDTDSGSDTDDMTTTGFDTDTDPTEEPPTDTESESETGPAVVPQPCELLEFDEEPPATWNKLGTDVAIAVSGGAMQFGIPSSAALGILQYGGPVDFDEMFLNTQIVNFTSTTAGTIVGLNFDTGSNTESVAIQLHGGNVEAIHAIPGQQPDVVSVTAPPLPFYVQLRAEAGQLNFEISSDGVVWTSVRSMGRPAFLDGANLNAFAGNWMTVSGSQVARLGELEVCN